MAHLRDRGRPARAGRALAGLAPGTAPLAADGTFTAAPAALIAYGLYETIEELDAIALFHTGQTGIGAGVPGGGGIRLKYSNPMCVDDVAVDLPRLKIIRPIHRSHGRTRR